MNPLRAYRIIAAALLLMLPSAAFADGAMPQEAGDAAVDTVIMVDRIQITAIKQGRTLRDKPIAATVLNAEAVERERITALKEASLTVPNFYVPDYGSRMTSSIYVRGLGARIDQPVVGMNIDNVPVMNKDAYDFDLFDIERIEVLRGPQSTLYGRNTMGGVINIYTLSPFTYQGVRIGAEYATANSVKLRLSSYVKFSERFAMSAAVNYNHSDGFFTNLYDNSDCGRENSANGRIKLMWRPDERIEIENVLTVSRARQTGYPYAYAGNEPLKDSTDSTVIAKGEIRYNDPCGYDRNTISDGFTLRCDGSRFSMASITSWQYLDDKMVLDQDFTPLSYFTLTQQRREHIIAEELVFRSKGESRTYDWICGAFGFYKHTDMHAPVMFKETGIEELIVKNAAEYSGITPEFYSDEILFDSRFAMPSAGAAVYHESTVHIGRFDLTAGVRLDYEYAKLRYDCTSVAVGMFGQIEIKPFENSGTMKKHFFEVLPKVSAVWRIDARNSMYASVSKGYKAGGFNTQMFSEVLQTLLKRKMGVGQRNFDTETVVAYEPEHSWNYEIGAHTATADGRFAADFAAFYIDCRNQQLTVFPEGQTTGRMMTNAGRSRSFGAELSARILPFENFSVFLSYGYTDARFIEFLSGRSDYAGKFVPYAPQHTAAARAEYALRVKTSWLEQIIFGAGYKGVGRIWWDEDNTLSQPFYSQLEASVRFSHKHWSAELWGRNLTNTRFDVFRFASISHDFLQRGKPRRLGVTLSVNF